MEILMPQIDEQIANKLGHYVYALLDPEHDRPERDRIFYVGKGQNNRCQQHARGAERLVEPEGVWVASPNIERIQAILNRGLFPEIKIVAHNLKRDEAFRIESILINLLDVANMNLGHRASDYWLAMTAIEERYGQPIDRTQLPPNILFVSLNATFPQAKTEKDLMDATLGNWTPGRANAAKVEYIVGVFGQLMRTFYKVQPQPAELAPIRDGGYPRFKWKGEVSQDLAQRFQDRSVNGQGLQNNLIVWTRFGRGQGCRFSA